MSLIGNDNIMIGFILKVKLPYDENFSWTMKFSLYSILGWLIISILITQAINNWRPRSYVNQVIILRFRLLILLVLLSNLQEVDR